MLKGKVLNLAKGFKAAKCTPSLKLIISRIKVLKNKRQAVVKQLRRDIAHLIELGEEQTAQLQVEYVIREEKRMAAYDYIEIFCEFVAARMSMIESQKACPKDLKEAISSLIFASPRCTEIPELKDVRKHFEQKYGKAFVTAATEIHPDCGVYVTLVEKLSAVRPDDQTKQKILSSIAEEYMLKWDPKSSVREGTKLCEEDLQAAHNGDHNKVPTVVIPLKHGVETYPTVINVLLNNVQCSSSSCLQDNLNAPLGFSVTITPEPTPSAGGIEAVDMKQMEEITSPLGGPHEYLEFPDAASAAQAAADAADRASMAARAAIELCRGGVSTKPSPSESDTVGGRSSEAIFTETDTLDDYDLGLVGCSMNNARADTEDLTDRVRLNLETLHTSNEYGHSRFQHVRGTDACRMDQASLGKWIPFFDSDSSDSSDHDNSVGTDRPVLASKFRVDSVLSRRTKRL
ncbi:hypothetical protein SAY86_010078 [Trapa natans]|uniref:IST1-like protein n=1 Tax=Trapa natans TaxID=22666 RepID=A0AAN7QTM9_TRANT|nr:hypothetical protein SAY86_010078 [Trapa natans]